MILPGQAEIARAWLDGQRRMWRGWSDAWQPPPPDDSGNDPLEQWRDLALRGLEVLGQEAVPIAEGMAQGALSAQRRLADFLEMARRTWGPLFEKMGHPEHWLSALEAYASQLRLGPAGPAGLAQEPVFASDLGRLWGLQVEELWKLSRPWLEALRLDPDHLELVASGDHSALVKFTDVYWDAYERTFGRLLESPSLGYTRELNARLVKAQRSLRPPTKVVKRAEGFVLKM